MANKLDVFAVLEFLDLNSFNVREAFEDDPDMLKQLDKEAGWMLPQWMSGAMNDAAHEELLYAFNTYCNPGWFKLYKHPTLQLKLLAAIGTGKKVKHKFYKPQTAVGSKIENLLLMVYPDIHVSEVDLWCRRNTESDLYELMNNLGLQHDETDVLVKEFRSRRGKK